MLLWMLSRLREDCVEGEIVDTSSDEEEDMGDHAMNGKMIKLATANVASWNSHCKDTFVKE